MPVNAVDKVMSVLAVIGGVVLALPALLHAIRLLLKAIPGDPGDAAVAWLEDKSQALADLLSKVMPKPPSPPAA